MGSDVGQCFVISADEEHLEDGHGLDLGTVVRLVGPPQQVYGAAPPEPRWRQFEILDGPEVGDWRNLDPRHVARARELLTDR